MAIVKMKKINIAAPMYDRDNILKLVQEKGCIQIVDLKEYSEGKEGIQPISYEDSIRNAETEFNDIKFTYGFLKKYSTKKESMFNKRDIISIHEFEDIEKKTDWRSIYENCKSIENSLNASKGRKAKLQSLVEQYTTFENLDINQKNIEELKRVSCIIGTVSKKYEAKIVEELSPFKTVYMEKISDKRQDLNILILCINYEFDSVFEVIKKYGFTKININLDDTPKNKLAALNEELNEIEKENEELVHKANKLAENLKAIEKMYDFTASNVEKSKTVSKLLKTKKTFILSGWITADDAKSFTKLLDMSFPDAYINTEDSTADDNPPVKLKNNKLTEPFEAITSMYALPLPTEIDPTPILTPFFMLFFGMMTADIGYGLVMFAATTFMLHKMDLVGDGKKIVKIIQYCSFPAILFGFLYGSFFGDAIYVKPLWVNPASSIMTVLYATFVIGLVQIYTGLGVKAYMLIKGGHFMDAVYDVFTWYAFVSGLIWMLLGGGTPAKILAIIGGVGLMLTQGRSNSTIAGKLFGGLYGVYGISGYLGDTLSYSRLLALGLSSGLIANAFNLLVRLLGKSPVALIFGAVLFLFGHTFNILIGGLGTFVHTCRLQYLEFFGKFYEGGGKAFDPLKISTKFINVDVEK
jgi:V/A-type H+-transporting ATPase subunit I